MFRFGKSNTKAGDEIKNQAVIIRSVYESSEDFGTDLERKNVEKLETFLIDKLGKIDAECDGHEIGDGEFIIYIYGLNADEIYETVIGVLKESSFQWFNITKRYGPAEDEDSREETFRLYSNSK